MSFPGPLPQNRMRYVWRSPRPSDPGPSSAVIGGTAPYAMGRSRKFASGVAGDALFRISVVVTSSMCRSSALPSWFRSKWKA